jgi:class 3 adenylate cyclase
MICDLVGSTALAARLDPEDMRAVIDAYHAACARITLTYGFLAEFRGDGILAYFGYPIAHEDDAERTVRAGLDIIAAVARLETRAAEPLAVRIGIATGVVVIGDLSREGALREHAVVGETPNLAARLQALAEPGTIVLAASTRRLLGELFHLRDLGRHEVKGIAEPVPAWAVEGVSASESRFEAELHHMRGKTLLTLGRKSEVEAELQRALTIAQQQQARWWELRAATSLAKYWYDEGKYLEAYSLLQPVYSWFVEGFETTYLRDAKALLDEPEVSY